MALQLSGCEFEAIRDKFLAIDTDGDGQLTREELSESFGKDKTDKVEFTIKLMDLDNNGVIEFHEFLEMVAFLEYKKGITVQKIKQFFQALDEDGSGTLSAEEIRKGIAPTGGIATRRRPYVLCGECCHMAKSW